MANPIVNGITPNALNATQKSVVWVRQTISFKIAIAKKNIAQRAPKAQLQELAERCAVVINGEAA